MMYFIKQIFEALRFAVNSVIVNKMRTLLSLMGITIGIFAIVSVFTAIDSMERFLKSNLETFGSTTLYIDKWPWMPEEDGVYKWWEYANRPNFDVEQFEEIATALEPNITGAATAFSTNFNLRNNKIARQTTTMAISHDYNVVSEMELGSGRYFTLSESMGAHPVAILGADIADELFEGVDPIGAQIYADGQRITVVGVLKRQGTNPFGPQSDKSAFVPIEYASSRVNARWYSHTIILMGKQDINLDEFKAITDHTIRRIRRQPFNAKSNFAVNEVTAVSQQLDTLFSMINLVGGIIGVFAILVGGFGVANIMFVSVRERTAQIGIQKAVGAKPYAILMQFVFEAIMLSVAGGAVGLLLIWALAAVATSATGFEIVLTAENIGVGLGISSAVGAIAGIFPAYSAASLPPVVAIYKNS